VMTDPRQMAVSFERGEAAMIAGPGVVELPINRDPVIAGLGGFIEKTALVVDQHLLSWVRRSRPKHFSARSRLWPSLSNSVAKMRVSA
jgi:hypothetical protein